MDRALRSLPRRVWRRLRGRCDGAGVRGCGACERGVWAATADGSGGVEPDAARDGVRGDCVRAGQGWENAPLPAGTEAEA